MILDTHQHFWYYDAQRDTWITEDMAILRRDYLPEDLHRELRQHGIDGCVAVQAAQTEEETKFLLRLASNNDFIRGVVGWTDLSSPHVRDRVVELATHEKLLGFRHIVQAETDPNFLVREPFVEGVRSLTPLGLTYDVLVYPHQLGSVLEFARMVPDQKLVLDHLGKPYIKDGFMAGWEVMMRELGKQPNLYAKLSGLVTEASWTGWRYEDFVPYLEIALEAFGPDRLMFGSDWPVCLLGGTYGEVFGIIDRFTQSVSEAEREKIFSGTARAFYGI